VSDKIVIAPDKFKGSLSAKDASEAMQRGVLEVKPNAVCILCPMADGGEGTVDVFLAMGSQRHAVLVSGPLGDPVDAVFAMNDRTAILEMASASGLELIPRDRRNPTRTMTFGTGEMIRAALDAGASRMIVGIGGSATNDAGIGMLWALGVRFFDVDGAELGRSILDFERLHKIDVSNLDARLKRVRIEVASDVDNPLCGPHGAAFTFAAQKGASPLEIERLDRILHRIAVVSKKTLGRDFSNERGAGAAGGLGFALMAFLGARLESGVRLIAREAGLDGYLEGAAMCLTGEGSIDEQTLHGKTVDGVAAIASEHNVPVIAFGGAVDLETAATFEKRSVEVVQIAPAGVSKDESMRDAARLLQSAVARAVSDRRQSPSPRSETISQR
jgi:glycerate kinase